jgi:hypothetical protein
VTDAEVASAPKPFRTWMPMVLSTMALLLALGLVWFVAAVAVPVWQVSRFIKDDYDGTSTAPRTGIARLGGPRSAVHKLRIYLRMPSWLVAHRMEAIDTVVRCGPEAKAAVPEIRNLMRSDDWLLSHTAADALKTILGEEPPK